MHVFNIEIPDIELSTYAYLVSGRTSRFGVGTREFVEVLGLDPGRSWRFSIWTQGVPRGSGLGPGSSSRFRVWIAPHKSGLESAFIRY